MRDQSLRIKLKVDADSGELVLTRKEFSKLSKGAAETEKSFNKSFDSMAKSALGFAAAYATVDTAMRVVDTFMELENAQIGVAKTTGLTGDEFRKLTGEIDAMAVAMDGFKVDGLYDTAEAAGQLGVTGVENISRFVRVIEMVGLTTELSSKESATGFAKLSNSLNEPIDKIEILASVANELSNTTSANVGGLLKYSQRLTGGAKTAGLMTDEIFGLSATMIDLAINFETGGTNINRVMLDIISDSNKFAEAIGEDSEAFASSVQNEPIEALQKLLVHMNGLSKTDAANFLTDLGYSGTEVKDVLLKLSSNTDLLTKNLKIAHDEYGRGTSISEEYFLASNGLDAQLTKVSGSLTLLAFDFGETLKDPILEVTGSIIDASEALRSMGVDNAMEDMVALGIGVAGATISMKMFTTAMAFNKTLTLGTALAETGYTAALTAELVVKRALTIANRAFSISLRAIPFVGVTSLLTYMASEALSAGDGIDYLNGKFEEGSLKAKEYSKSMAILELTKIKSLAREQSIEVGQAYREIRHGSDKQERTELRATYDGLKQQLDSTLKARDELLGIIDEANNKKTTTPNNGSKAESVKPNGLEEWDASLNYLTDSTKDLQAETERLMALRAGSNSRYQSAIDEQLSKITSLNDTMIAATGTNYDKWLNDTNKQMLDMVDNGASAEQMMQVFNASLSEFEQTGINDTAESMDSILDAQIKLAESGLDWGNSLEGVAKQINNVSKAVTQSYVGKLKYEKEDIKLQNKYAKAYLKADGDVSKQKELGAQFDKDQAVLKEANNSAEMAAYANLAGAMGSAYEDGTNGAIAFAAVQSALGIASSWTAIAQAWALPFPANIPAAAMVAANVMPIIDQLGGSGGGGGSSSAASSFDVNRENIENTYDPITDRLDRQIELLEQLNFAGTASAVKVELATETFNRDYKLFVEDTIQGMGTYLRPHWFGYHTSGDSAEFMRSMQGAEDTTGIDVFNSYGLTDESAQIYQRYDNDIVRLNGDALRSGTNMLEFLEYVSTNQDIYLTAWIRDIDGVLNEYFNITSEYVQSMLSVVDEMQGASDTFKEVYDQISGTNRYEKEKLKASFGEVNSLVGTEGLEAYLVEQIEAIDGLSEVFNQNIVDLFLSEDPTMLSEQIDALMALSDATGIAFEAGVEDALNYIESIELVGKAIATSAANIKEWEDSSKTNNELASQMGAALGLTVANTFDELDSLFTQLSNDAFGLTDKEFSFLEANRDLLEETQSIFSDTLGSMVDTLTSASESISNTSAGLRSNALGSTFGIESYYASMSETKSLLSEGNYDAFSESLNKTIGYSSALSDSNNYTSTRDMQFNQLVAANQFDALDVQVSDELTTLKTISETILTQVDQNEKLLDVTEQQAEEIRTMRKEIQDQSVLIAELGVTG